MRKHGGLELSELAPSAQAALEYLYRDKKIDVQRVYVQNQSSMYWNGILKLQEVVQRGR